MQAKEKYELEMKKEIKRLQRIRDFCRMQMNSSDIKDKSRLQEGCKRVERVSAIKQAHLLPQAARTGSQLPPTNKLYFTIALSFQSRITLSCDFLSSSCLTH